MFRTFLLIGASAMALAATSAGAVTFVYTGAAQNYAAQYAGIYNVAATGARGGAGTGGGAGGQGIAVGAHVTVGAATNLAVIVGGVGKSGIYSGHGGYGSGGGGGGSFVLGADASAVVVAGGGGGGGYQYNSGGSGSAGNAGASGSGTGFGTGGTAGLGGHGGTYSYGYNGGGGGGLKGRGSDGFGFRAGSGGSSAPGFAGGVGTQVGPNSGGAGGFGGGGAAGYLNGGGGGGGGFSGGGGGGGGGFGGGGGGSFTMAGATNITSQASTLADGNGAVSIDALRYFASPTVATDPLNFGTVRADTTSQASLTVGNNVVAGTISDALVTVLGTTPSQITSSAAPGPLVAGQTATVTYTLAATTPGVLSGNVALGFTSHAATGPDVALSGVSVGVTGTVTDPARAVLGSTGSGLLTFANGSYVLNLGTVAAGSRALSTGLNVTNGVAASSYAETLGGTVTGLTAGGFNFAGSSFSGLTGGATAVLGTLGFSVAGLSNGFHSQTLNLSSFSHFAGLSDLALASTSITVEANILAPPSITNGSFETGIAPGKSTLLLAGDTTSLPGWTVGGTVDIVGPAWVASDGVRSVDLSGIGPGDLSQTVTGLIAGVTYRLTFDLSGSYSGIRTAANNLDVSATGNAVQLYAFAKNNTNADMLYDHLFYDFTATGSSSVIDFAGLDEGDYGAVLDNVAIGLSPQDAAPLAVQSAGLGAVAEPASWAMMIGGFGMIGAAQRRLGRRRAAAGGVI